MILQDGVNGRFIEFDAAKIVGVLAEFSGGKWKPSTAAQTRVPDSETYAQRLVDEMLAAASHASAGAANSQTLITPA